MLRCAYCNVENYEDEIDDENFTCTNCGMPIDYSGEDEELEEDDEFDGSDDELSKDDLDELLKGMDTEDDEEYDPDDDDLLDYEDEEE